MQKKIYHADMNQKKAGVVTLIKNEINFRAKNITRDKESNLKMIGASLVAQWLRICLPLQGTRVRALVWEDPTCRRATKPMRHNY